MTNLTTFVANRPVPTRGIRQFHFFTFSRLFQSNSTSFTKNNRCSIKLCIERCSSPLATVCLWWTNTRIFVSTVASVLLNSTNYFFVFFLLFMATGLHSDTTTERSTKFCIKWGSSKVRQVSPSSRNFTRSPRDCALGSPEIRRISFFHRISYTVYGNRASFCRHHSIEHEILHRLTSIGGLSGVSFVQKNGNFRCDCHVRLFKIPRKLFFFLILLFLATGLHSDSTTQ